MKISILSHTSERSMIISISRRNKLIKVYMYYQASVSLTVCMLRILKLLTYWTARWPEHQRYTKAN